MSYEKATVKMEEYNNLPYTIVKHTPLLPSFSITLTAVGLKKLIENCHDEDLIHITVHDKKKTEFEISKFVKD